MEDEDHEYINVTRAWVQHVFSYEFFMRWVRPVLWIWPLKELMSTRMLHEHVWVGRGWTDYKVLDEHGVELKTGKIQLLSCADCNAGRTEPLKINDEPFDLGPGESKEFHVLIRMPGKTSGWEIIERHS